MKYETTTEKGYDGWTARSEAVLGETPKGTRILKLTTSKARGGVDATASVCIRSKCSTGFTSETFVIFGDFYKRGIAPMSCSRVTEKAVREAHQIALEHMDQLVEEAKAFYSNREAQSESKRAM
ncbi:hypothetical protein [Cerasicoccus fimbriatus]|uniref:hypothetical protein n=1 Tax=Cerasicoccus fimbriatus TaxID=3014554 RepID=UPI0022B38B74|nr:hypothetical protein [Cerasicoccus sp. TK19100]